MQLTLYLARERKRLSLENEAAAARAAAFAAQQRRMSASKRRDAMRTQADDETLTTNMSFAWDQYFRRQAHWEATRKARDLEHERRLEMQRREPDRFQRLIRRELEVASQQELLEAMRELYEAQRR